ncbi:MAG: hypothetical protein PHI18_02310, partial [bacterium]|nr:hypothetical protein [bacterium]
MTISAASQTDLAGRIEAANARSLISNVEAAQRLFPDSGAAAMPVAGGVAAFVGADLPISYAVGLGLNGPVTEADISQVVDFYHSHGAVPRVDACALADPSLLEALRSHHFQLHWFVNVLARDLAETDDRESDPPEISVRQAAADEAELWVRVVDGGFSDGGPLTENHRRMCLMFFHHEGAQAYLAEVNGRPA